MESIGSCNHIAPIAYSPLDLSRGRRRRYYIQDTSQIRTITPSVHIIHRHVMNEINSFRRTPIECGVHG